MYIKRVEVDRRGKTLAHIVIGGSLFRAHFIAPTEFGSAKDENKWILGRAFYQSHRAGRPIKRLRQKPRWKRVEVFDSLDGCILHAVRETGLLDELLSQMEYYSRTCPHLECDGLVRVLGKVLADRGVPHTTCIGHIRHSLTGQGMEPHFWIELADDHRVDFRARMWLGERDDVPHGVFDSADYPDVEYQGEPVDLGRLSEEVFRVLVTPVPEDVIRQLVKGEKMVLLNGKKQIG